MTTFVLIHGAYQGGWIWQRIASRLRAAGHAVHTPTLDGCAERRHALRPGITTETHGQEIADLLYYEDLHDAVLVGTSSGGMVMAAAAERAPERIRRLVFADALALLDGEKIRDVVTRPASIEGELGIGPDRDDAANRLLAGLDDATRQWGAERMTLHPRAVFYEPVKLPRFWSMPWQASVLYCSGAPNPGEAHIRRTRDRLDGRWHTIATGHYPMLSTPDELTSFILSE
jgi:pimeloyl-ACP methyl ester carboxylesterase